MGTSRIIGSLDNWLTSHGVDHPYIRPVIRNQVLLTLIVFVIGLAAAFASPWILWADAGIAVMTVIICSWTRYFLKTKLEGTVSMRMPGVILRFFPPRVPDLLSLCGAYLGKSVACGTCVRSGRRDVRPACDIPLGTTHEKVKAQPERADKQAGKAGENLRRLFLIQNKFFLAKDFRLCLKF